MAEETNRRGADDIAAGLTGNSPFFGAAKGPRVVQLQLTVIERNPDQPRKSFNEEKLNELKTSIDRHGLLQPITVKALDSDRYLLVAGERRYRAFELLERETIPAIITTGDPDELALIENLQRENLNPVEEAVALSRLREIHSWTQEQLGEALGKTKSAVSMTLKVLELPKDILEVETSQPEPLPKSILLEIARVKGAKKQKELYDAARRGQVATARAAREARMKPKQDPKYGTEATAKGAITRQAIRLGQGLVNTLEQITDEYLAENQAEYARLAALVERLNQRLEATRAAIGEPTAPLVVNEATEEATA